jgi:poly-gamma-glutamate synthesis protein (capsule biosynthesis protein)
VVAGTYGLNGFPLPEGREWSVSMLDVPDLLRQARAARAAGADIVVVHLHAGWEYDEQPNAEQVAAVERLTRSPDVDLVLGEHAHTVQPITKVNGTWVVYGMGNLVAQQELSRPETYRGILVRFAFVERPDGSFEVRRAAYVPVGWNHVSAGPIRVRRLDDPGDQAARAAVIAAVNGLGPTPGLRDE